LWSGYVYPVFLFCAISAAKELEGFVLYMPGLFYICRGEGA